MEILNCRNKTNESCKTANWATIYDKPLFISETGAEAKGGFISSTKAMWSEDYQAWYYKEQITMLKRMPANFSGISPWILADFRSPRRNNPTYQQGWNTKGLIDRNGNKKKAFFLLKNTMGRWRKCMSRQVLQYYYHITANNINREISYLFCLDYKTKYPWLKMPGIFSLFPHVT